MKKSILLILSLLFFTLCLFGQHEILLGGYLKDKKTKEPLPFASVFYKTKETGTITDINGSFRFSLPEGSESDSIIMSHIGYLPLKFKVSECINKKVFEFTVKANEIKEVVIKSKKFNLNNFMRETIAIYNKNRKDEAHIAIAHYREKARKNGHYIMYMESLGYSVYSELIGNASKLSNYHFFCENTKCYVSHYDWLAYSDILTQDHIPPSCSTNLNAFRKIETGGLLSIKYSKKYHYKIDSFYYINNNEVLSVKFTSDKFNYGTIHIYSQSKQIIKIEYASNYLWSFPYNKRVNANISIIFNYYNNTPYIKSIESSYNINGLEHIISLSILVQKYFPFKLNRTEYWAMNNYDMNPFIQYIPAEWDKYNIPVDADYKSIEKDLSNDGTSLNEQFVKSSGYWFIKATKNQEPVIKAIHELKKNF